MLFKILFTLALLGLLIWGIFATILLLFMLVTTAVWKWRAMASTDKTDVPADPNRGIDTYADEHATIAGDFSNLHETTMFFVRGEPDENGNEQQHRIGRIV
ncbi:hypothetical protein VTJ49DRAFT_4598 [Mycothermus thermophilus]|uniref:Uncharacterized protein n=1 Tax=Humicola insolens TaxID=85995 RepID=A0ABR3V507_HUMIN